MKTPRPPVAPGPVTLLDRDASILAFNERVLAWAHRSDVPPLERLRYLCIVSSNLDEFFEIRAAPHLLGNREAPATGAPAAENFRQIARLAHALVERQYAIYNDEVLPALARHGIRIVPHGERNRAERQWVQQYFDRAVRPLLVPVSLDPSHPFPLVANKSLNFVVRLNGVDAFGRDNEIAIVKVPRTLQRMIQLPAKLSGGDQLWVSLSSVIRAHLHELFTSREVTQFSQFRVTRHSDLAIDEEEVKNLRTALRLGLQQRHFREAVRLEVSSGCSTHLSDFLLAEFKLPPEALYRVHGPVNMVRLSEIVTHARSPKLLFPAHQPVWPLAFRGAEQSVFERIRQGDALVHHPFESFDAVLAFLREAVEDPAVLAIKQTIYRTGARSALMDLLEEAVRRGKDVTVVVELKARFDEEVNINWAERLESIGAQVVYGVVGLKTHAKMLLVTRREGSRLRRYAHLSTGNYNPVTARLYTDISYFSCDAALTMDVDNVFLHLASQIRLPRLRRLLVAPLTLHHRLQARVDAVGAAARDGRAGRIIIKTNALTDEPLIRALIRAEYPGHGILGEEFGAENTSNDHVWIIDPIDGTRSFISGIPLWGTLVGLTKGGDAIAGMMAQPFTGEIYMSLPGEAHYHRGAEHLPLKTSGVTELAKAKLTTTSPDLFLRQGRDLTAEWNRIERSVLTTRYGLDCYGYALLAAGHIDLVVEAGLKNVDICPLIPLIENAGGVVTTWDGGPAEQGGNCVAAATPELHAAAMAMLKG